MPIPTTHEVAETTMAAPGTSIDAAYPDNMAIGNLIHALIWGGGTFNLPTDWFLIRAQGETTFGSGESRTFYHIVDGEEEPTVEFTWTDTMYGSAVLTRITGHNPLNPINNSSGAAGANTDTPVSPAVVTDEPDCLILRTVSVDRISVSPIAPPAGHTEIWDFNGAVSFDASASAGATIGQASAGDSGTATFTMSGARPSALQTVAIEGASGGAFELGPGTLESQSELTGNLSLTIGLTGAIVSRSQMSGALSLTRGLTGVVASRSALSAALGLRLGLSGAVVSRSALVGSLGLNIGLSGTVASRSVLSGSLGVIVGLSGVIASRSALAGNLSFGTYSGVIASRSSWSGNLSLRSGLSGVVSSRSALVGNVGLRISLSGVVASRSVLTGNLTTGSEVQFDDVSIRDLTPALMLRDVSPILRIV